LLDVDNRGPQLRSNRPRATKVSTWLLKSLDDSKIGSWLLDQVTKKLALVRVRAIRTQLGRQVVDISA